MAPFQQGCWLFAPSRFQDFRIWPLRSSATRRFSSSVFAGTDGVVALLMAFGKFPLLEPLTSTVTEALDPAFVLDTCTGTSAGSGSKLESPKVVTISGRLSPFTSANTTEPVKVPDPFLIGIVRG